MKQLKCPLNGLRNISEFVYGGEYHPMPDADKCSESAWAEYVFFHDNAVGEVVEWWCHAASSYWFLAKRNTVTDEVIATYTVADWLAEGEQHG